MMKPLVLLSCVALKKPGHHPAKELYQSEWFKKAWRYGEQLDGEPYILSAKHHLVQPDQIIEDYNLTLKSMPKEARQAWAKTVLRQLKPLITPGREVVFLAGKYYREFLVAPLQEAGARITIPMVSLGIGQQLAWLKQHTEPLEKAGR